MAAVEGPLAPVEPPPTAPRAPRRLGARRCGQSDALRARQLQPYCGTWIKVGAGRRWPLAAGHHAAAPALIHRHACPPGTQDKEASESMDTVCALLGLGRLLRAGINLIRGLDIALQPDGETVVVGVFSALPVFRLNERHALHGGEARNNRRDLRLGGMLSRVAVDGRRVVLSMRYCGGSFAATARDELELLDADTLRVTTTVALDAGGPDAVARQVYRRAGAQ